MMSEYTIRVILPNGSFNNVVIRAASPGAALSQAAAFGRVSGILESRYVQ